MKAGIITIIDNNNYGNRLQNYAVQEYLKKKGIDVSTLKNIEDLNFRKNFIYRILKYIYRSTKHFLKKILKKEKEGFINRKKRFEEFNKNINFYKRYVTAYSKVNSKFDYFITGSDQVWNPSFFRLSDVDFLCFADPKKRIAFSASFGVSQLPYENSKIPKKYLNDFRAISVREDRGKEIVEELTNRNDVEVLLDPTMLLTAEDWDKVSKKPKQLKFSKYILNYFLGEISEERKKEINRIAKENECEIINILDKNSPFYATGPSEFLYLEKNAFLVCTDSFHSCVFAIIYNRPFIVFDREEKTVNMSSRIETLLNKFELKNQKFSGKITEENLKYNYEKAYKILENEKIKANEFLSKALNIE